MLPKIESVKPKEKGQRVTVHPFELRPEVREFLRANEGKRISVVFTGAFRKRLCKVFVNYVNCNCGCCSPFFEFER